MGRAAKVQSFLNLQWRTSPNSYVHVWQCKCRLESLNKEMAEIKAELRKERSKHKKAGTKARKLDQPLKYTQKNKFGNKR